MSLSLDIQYVALISPRIDKMQRKHDYLWNFRCPMCGDSHKTKTKMRGYIYRKGNDLFMKCHNCGAGLSLGNFIKFLDPALYKQYILERYKSGEVGLPSLPKTTIKISAPKFDKLDKKKTFENAERCDKLPKGHFCLEYLKSRHIPKNSYKRLFYTDNYKAFCDEIYPEHGKEIAADKRLIIPFYNEYNDIIAVSGRALEASTYKLRYVTVRTNTDDAKLVYGKDRVMMNEKLFLVEGPLDSLFLNNCLASGDANLALTATTLGLKDCVLIYDCEPRNKEVVKMIKKAIDEGFKVVIWPENITQKDINEMIISGMSQEDLETIISNNTVSGIEATLRFNYWKKV